MSTCIPRNVLGAGDRPGRVKAAAQAVEVAARAITAARVQPHAGAFTPSDLGGRSLQPWQPPILQRTGGGPSSGGANGMGGLGPLLHGLSTAISTFVREVSDTITADASNTNDSDRLKVVINYQPYTEPMTIPAPANFSVAAVVCARAVVTSAPAEVLRHGTACEIESFNNGSVTLKNIDGLAVGDPRVITWTFVYFGV